MHLNNHVSHKYMDSVAVRVENEFGEEYLKINVFNATKFYSCIVWLKCMEYRLHLKPGIPKKNHEKTSHIIILSANTKLSSLSPKP
jgi:hypothetical protein